MSDEARQVALRYVNINKKMAMSVIRLPALMCEKVLLILNIELIFFLENYIEISPFMHNFVQTTFFHMKKILK